MTRTLLITTPARTDLRDIRRYTLDRHGRVGADAYDMLIKQALRDLRDDPFRPGAKARPEIGGAIRSYHLINSRERAAPRIKRPRHFILYFLPSEDEVAVSRVLHDSRDLARHVPRDHLEDAGEDGEE